MKTERINTKRTLPRGGIYNYSDVFCREETVAFLLDYASKSKLNINEYWNNMRRYYDGEHDIRKHTGAIYEKHSLPWRAAQSTDGYLHVESLIEPEIPDFEFSPRSDKQAETAKQREAIARYILDVNDMSCKNSRNERRLGIYGSAIWKVCWDSKEDNGGFKGEVCIDAPDPAQIFPDPSATDLDSCEYIGYVYKMHVQRASRVFEKDLRARKTDISDYLQSSGHAGVLVDSDSYSPEEDTVTVTEWWFRQPEEGSLTIKNSFGPDERSMKYTWKSGDVGLCVFINGKEIKYIPKYWTNTKCQMLPFVIYNKIPNEKSVWGKSELEQIIPFIDAADREMAFAQLNSAFSSNDIIILEENALSDDAQPDNSPGAVWKLRPGMMGKVQRLGNLSAHENSLYNACSFWRGLTEDTTGNFEVNQGKEPTSVTTATGIALLGERAQTRKALKSIDRNAGFKRLYRLVDMTALEFYDDGRVLRLSDDKKKSFSYKFSDFTCKKRDVCYIPQLDVVIHTGSGIANSRAFTLSALNTLMSMGITQDNYELVKAYLDEISIPQRAQIKQHLDKKYGKEADKENDGNKALIENKLDAILSGKDFEI